MMENLQACYLHSLRSPCGWMCRGVREQGYCLDRHIFMRSCWGFVSVLHRFHFFRQIHLGLKNYARRREILLLQKHADISGRKSPFYDLYSGTGTIAQILAPVSGHVIGVEIVEEGVEAAKKNALENGLTNCDFIAGDVLKVIDEIEEKPDYIVLDPPRDGIHPKALDKIIAYGVESIVSIFPASRPASQEIWKSYRRADIRSSGSAVAICLPARRMLRR